MVWCANIYSRTYNAKSQRTGLEWLTDDTRTSQNGWTSIYMIEFGSGIHLGKKKIQSLGIGLACPTGLALPYVAG